MLAGTMIVPKSCSSMAFVHRTRKVISVCQKRSSTSVSKETKAVQEGTAASSHGGGSSKSGTGPSSFFQTLWESYTAALFARPLTVKATTASIIFFFSDSATQKLMDPDSDWDTARAGSGAAFGVVATGWLHYWWGFLEASVERRLPVATNRLANTLVKVFLDQAIGAPLYIYTYYVITNYIQEANARRIETQQEAVDLLHETSDKATEMLPPTMLRHWTLWPAVHTLNFYFNPLHHRVLVQNLVLVGWSGYLSHLNNGGLMTPKKEVEETIKRRESIRATIPTAERSSSSSEGTAAMSQEKHCTSKKEQTTTTKTITV